MSIDEQNKKHEIEMINNTMFIRNVLCINDISHFLNEANLIISTYSNNNLKIDLSELEFIDSGGVVALEQIKKSAVAKGLEFEFINTPEQVSQKIELFNPNNIEKAPAPVKRSNIAIRIGGAINNFISDYLIEFILLSADVFYWSFADLFRKKVRRKGEAVNQAILIGVKSFGIVTGLTFIIGLVLAVQSSEQLRLFGANVFIVELTVMSMVREMGPLITAILVAGRSGSAIAAEIATMKVTSELDALKTMALNPIRFTVVPKIYGALLTMPFLTVMANIAGIIGGMIAASIYLDIGPEIFINRIDQALEFKDIITGLIKSLVFAIIIVITGSFFGFRVVRGAEGVGIVTTSAVVTSITLVIVADSILGLLFY